MRTIEWDASVRGLEQVQRMLEMATSPGVLTIRFSGPRAGSGSLPWSVLEAWTRTRAVTVADLAGDPGFPALEVALCADLVVLREGVELRLPGQATVPPAGLVWAAGRAGPRALRRVLLTDGVLDGEEAVELGLVHRLVGAGDPLPVPDPCSGAALTTARDLVRAGASWEGSLALESAAFRLLFALGHPEEGARAFLERREPRFGPADPGE